MYDYNTSIIKQYQYLLDCITITDFNGNEVEDQSESAKIFHAVQSYENQAGNRKRQTSNGLIQSIARWMDGMPTDIDIAIWNDDRIALAKEWGVLKNATEDEELELLNDFSKILAMRLLEMYHALISQLND